MTVSGESELVSKPEVHRSNSTERLPMHTGSTSNNRHTMRTRRETRKMTSPIAARSD